MIFPLLLKVFEILVITCMTIRDRFNNLVQIYILTSLSLSLSLSLSHTQIHNTHSKNKSKKLYGISSNTKVLRLSESSDNFPLLEFALCTRKPASDVYEKLTSSEVFQHQPIFVQGTLRKATSKRNKSQFKEIVCMLIFHLYIWEPLCILAGLSQCSGNERKSGPWQIDWIYIDVPARARADIPNPLSKSQKMGFCREG